MGKADLAAAFNDVARPAYTAHKAFLKYERAGETQYQRLVFVGIGGPDGAAFEVQSELLRPGTDVNNAARVVAQKLVDSTAPPA